MRLIPWHTGTRRCRQPHSPRCLGQRGGGHVSSGTGVADRQAVHTPAGSPARGRSDEVVWPKYSHSSFHRGLHLLPSPALWLVFCSPIPDTHRQYGRERLRGERRWIGNTCWHLSRGPSIRNYLSLSRLNHWLPRAQAHPEVMEGTAQFHHEITDALLPEADPVFDN